MVYEIMTKLDIKDLIQFSMTNTHIKYIYDINHDLLCEKYDSTKSIKLCYQLLTLIDHLKLNMSIQSCYEIQDLIVLHQQLNYIPAGINHLNLNNLVLYNNDIRYLPAMDNLIHLKKLDLSYNHLESVPDLGNLINLTHLDISNNKLIWLPESINRLVKLRNLILSHNQLTKLPSINQLIELRELYIDNNNIVSIPDYAGLNNLVFFNFSNNPL